MRSSRSTPAGRASGWCCHSSARTRSTSPSASAGSDSSGSDSTSSQRRLGRRSYERLYRRHGEVESDRLEGGDPPPPGDPAGGSGQLGLRELGPPEQRLGVAHQHQRGVGQPDAPACRLEQLDARLAFQHGELLRDGRRSELQGVGHGGDRAPGVQLVQQAQSA